MENKKLTIVHFYGSMNSRCSHASFGAPGSMGPIGKNATVESICKEVMRHMKNAAHKVMGWIKGLNVSVAGKVKLGFVEITAAPR